MSSESNSFMSEMESEPNKKVKRCYIPRSRKICSENNSQPLCGNKTPCPPQGNKNPCPLRSFCDYGLNYSCNRTPIVEQTTPTQYITTWKNNYLVSSVREDASHYDPDLIYPGDVVIVNNQLWVTTIENDKVLNYDRFGNKLIHSIDLRWNNDVAAFPVGIAVNCNGGFTFRPNDNILDRAYTSELLITSFSGDIFAVNPQTNTSKGYIVIDNLHAGEIASYSGCCIVGNILYVADWNNAHVDLYDSNYVRVGGRGRLFIDNYSIAPIPVNYSVNNVAYIEPYIYVAYAEKDIATMGSILGAGRGYVSVFTLDGGFVRRFYSGGVLNSPYSIIPAPNVAGIPANSILISNEGDGRINIFDYYGNHVGVMISQSGVALSILGLRVIRPFYTTINEIFYVAGTDPQNNGSLGSLVPDQIIAI